MPAQMYPSKENISDLPYSESLVYDLLASLAKSFTIFHSVRWVIKRRKRNSIWKENDFLLLNQKLGGLVLEVKGGEIEYRDGVFHQKNKETGEEKKLSQEKRNDPLSQAVDGAYHYRELIDDIIPDISTRFPINTAVWFSSCDIRDKINSFPHHYKEVSETILGHEDFERKGTAIYDVFDYWTERGTANVTDEEYKKIVDSIASDFNLVSAPGVKKGELDYTFLKLTNEQMGLLDYISEQNNATIQGVAGTGKTIIAKEAARRFGEDGRKVLFLCYNKFLYQYLERSFPYNNVTFLNIHRFIAQYRRGKDTSTVDKRVYELKQIDPHTLDYDDIIIDEAQDFYNDEILYFKNCAELRSGHFYVFYDKNQILTTTEVPQWIRESECRLILTKNCRNTYEIAKTSYNVIDIQLNQKIMMIKGVQPTISFINGPIQAGLSQLINKLTDGTTGYNYSDIVILTLKSESNSVLRSTFELSGVPITRPESESVSPSIMFTTASKFKGLESRVVIIVDIDESCFTDEEKKRLFYVACSRATQRLSLVVNGDNGIIDSIAHAINNNGSFSSQGIIAIKTQSTILDLQ